MIRTISPHLKIKTYPSPEVTLRQAGKALQSLLKKYRSHPLLFLATGGSSIALLSLVDPDVFGPHVTLTVTDDRWSHNPNVNNFSQAMASPLYISAQDQGCQFIDTRPVGDESVEAMGKRFDSSLKAWVKQYPKGVIVMTQGIGADSHTCGMLPYPENPALFRKMFQDEKIWAIGYDAQGKTEYPKRVTITIPFLQQKVTQSIGYMVGENKRQALETILNHQDDFATKPGRLIWGMKSVLLLTDIKF